MGVPPEESHEPDASASVGHWQACIQYLEEKRWGQHPCRPQCGRQRVARKQDGKRSGRWNCHGCKSSFNVLSGTIVERTMAMPKWFLAVGCPQGHPGRVPRCRNRFTVAIWRRSESRNDTLFDGSGTQGPGNIPYTLWRSEALLQPSRLHPGQADQNPRGSLGTSLRPPWTAFRQLISPKLTGLTPLWWPPLLVDEETLRQKLAKVEELFRQAGSPGERAAAEAAIGRLHARLDKASKDQEPEVELKFLLPDRWSMGSDGNDSTLDAP